MQRGVIYMALRDRHACVLAVSLRTLRQCWTGPVTIFCHGTGAWLRRLANDAAAELVPFAPRTQSRNEGYANKPRLPAMSPFEATLQLDADTIVIRLGEEIWPQSPEETVITSFAGWTSQTPTIVRRLQKWAAIEPQRVAAQLASPVPAVNTGVLAFGADAVVARELWLQTTLKNRHEFICDEIAMQLLATEPHVRIVDDRWNWSPWYGRAARGDVKIVHCHGKKHVSRGFDVWWPEFVATCRANYGRILEWLPAGDRRLAELLGARPELRRDLGITT